MHGITKIKIFILFSCTQHLKHSHYSNPALWELTVSETVNVNVDPGIKALHQMQTCRLMHLLKWLERAGSRLHDMIPLPRSPDSCKGVWDNPITDCEEIGWMLRTVHMWAMVLAVLPSWTQAAPRTCNSGDANPLPSSIERNPSGANLGPLLLCKYKILIIR